MQAPWIACGSSAFSERKYTMCAQIPDSLILVQPRCARMDSDLTPASDQEQTFGGNYG